jgi:predicted glycosyltransferase
MSIDSSVKSSLTVLFQPPNHVGLGHLNRLSAIALALRRISPSIRTPFIVEGAAHVLLEALGLPYIPLPSEHAMNETDWWTAWPKGERSSISLEISRAILTTVRPQIVVFDCLPNPAFLAATIENHIPIVLCLREMRELARYLKHVQNLLTGVSLVLVLVPHDPGEFELPAELRQKACYVGRIARPFESQSKTERNQERPRILISGGGGGYPGTVNFYNLAIRALSALRIDYPGLEARLIVGPLFSDWLQLQQENGITVVPFEPDTLGAFAAADLVIAQAGYNTVAELEQVGTKGILVPAERQWDDQFLRVDRAVQTCPQFRAFRSSSHIALAALAADLLRETNLVADISRPRGAVKAAERLYAMLQQQSPGSARSRGSTSP